MRRLITIPVVVILFLSVTGASPVLLTAGLIVDTARWVARRSPWVSVRMIAFLWCYLAGQVWAIAAIALTSFLGAKRRIEATYRLQQRWASWNLAAVRTLFQLEFDVTGSAALQPGPIVVLSRHTSLIDTLLPAVLITREAGIRLRYVLKKELLVDPALDLAGNRLPNLFVDRGAGESERERGKIRELASSLDIGEGILIYPEGTRFSHSKRERAIASLGSRSPLGDLARSFRWVLPPRPGGTLAILEASETDVVLLAHTGLEGFATVKDIWRGDLVGSKISVDFRRVARGQIPDGRSEQVLWLFGLWAELDSWVDLTQSSGHHPL